LEATGPQTIEITDQNRKTCVMTFNEKFTAYTAVHFDGKK